MSAASAVQGISSSDGEDSSSHSVDTGKVRTSGLRVDSITRSVTFYPFLH